jgi:hypothetical protein
MISSFHDDATPATASLNLAHSFARYFQLFMIIETLKVPKVSVTRAACDHRVFWNARRNGRAGITRRATRVLRISLTAVVARGAHVSISHGRSQVCDDVIILTVIQQVDPLGCGYLTIKYDALAPGT